MDPEPPPKDAIIPSETERVTVNRRERVEVDSENPSKKSAGNYGCLGSIAIWTLGWVAVASLAISRAWQFPDGSAILAAIVSGMVAFIGCRISLALLRRNSPGNFINASSYISVPRQAIGWLSAILSAALVIAWNFVVFEMLINLARAGRGWMILFLLFASLIGLFLLFVLLTGIGVIIDSRRRDSGRSN
jgi:hypothetical protein